VLVPFWNGAAFHNRIHWRQRPARPSTGGRGRWET
jgi:hypothetical protein